MCFQLFVSPFFGKVQSSRQAAHATSPSQNRAYAFHDWKEKQYGDQIMTQLAKKMLGA